MHARCLERTKQRLRNSLVACPSSSVEHRATLEHEHADGTFVGVCADAEVRLVNTFDERQTSNVTAAPRNAKRDWSTRFRHSLRISVPVVRVAVNLSAGLSLR